MSFYSQVKSVTCHKSFGGLIVALLSSATFSTAQDTTDSYRLELDLPLLDFPFSSSAIETSQTTNSFSMQQSLAITQNFHNLNYYFNNKIWKKKYPILTNRKKQNFGIELVQPLVPVLLITHLPITV